MVIRQDRIDADHRSGLLPQEFSEREDREPSRAQALHRGLRDSPAIPDDLETARERSRDWSETLKPRDGFHAWLVGQVAVLTLRVDRCQGVESRLRDRHALGAELAWDDDRRREAEALGSRIGKEPGEVARALRRTPQGCDWLMGRWALLAHAADSQGRWTPAQAALAFDLLGTPAEFREGRDLGLALDAEGRAVGPGEGTSAVARRQIAGLREQRETAAGLDEVDRSLARAGLSDEFNAELKALRRYESSLHGRLRWCFSQLKPESPGPGIHPRRVERPEPQATAEPTPLSPEPERRPAVAGLPEIDREPGEEPGLGRAADVPAIQSPRRAREVRKAEARRENCRRKLERLRA